MLFDNNLANLFFSIDCHAEQNHAHWDFYIAKNDPTSKAHKFEEPLIVCSSILKHESTTKVDGEICEFGCYTGISSAKLSIVSNFLNKKLFIFDSFEGLPEIDANASQEHKDMYTKGQYCCSLDTVKKNVQFYGNEKNVSFVKGFFSESLPSYEEIEKISYCFVDVDLCKSLEECLDFILPRLQKNGILFSHEAKDPDYEPVFQKYGLLNKENYESFGVGSGILDTNICFFVKK
jgi:O-methyltransferase